MPGRVVRVDDVGRYRVVKLDLDGHPFNAIADEDAEIARRPRERRARSGERPHLRRRPPRRRHADRRERA